MHPKFAGVTLSAFLVLAACSAASMAADAKGKAKVTYQDQVSTIFRNRCNTCHNADKQKGGLNLETYGTAMQGGGSGKVVEPGDPDSSTLLNLVSHKDEPKMPPNAPKIPDAEIDVIRLWIEGGALETTGSVAAVAAKPKFEFKLDPSATGKPAGPPAMPEKVLTEPVVASPRAGAIVALASSPWAPLLAIGGHKQVLLYDTARNHLAGVLPFPEGTVYVVKFSRNGSLVLAGGGRGGQSGLAVVWDVKTGKRVFEIGKEYDAVLAADISPDHGQVALGGPGKVVRVYSTADGQLMFEMRKHTEWITALEFSPDGVLLATGDRNNGLLVWEAQTGREFFDLRGHTAAITDLSWRLDSNVVASSSEDGSVKLWEMENGTAVKSLAANPGGTSSVRFAKDGRLVTTGRDRLTRLWDANGTKLRDFEAFGDVALDAVFTGDDSRVVAGDWAGEVRVWEASDGKRITNLAANPAPISSRLETARKLAEAAQADAENAIKAFASLRESFASQTPLQARATEALNASIQDVADKKALADASERSLRACTVEENAAIASLKAAETAALKASTDRKAAENAVPATEHAEKVAAESLAASKSALDSALARKVEQDKALVAAVNALKGTGDKKAADQGAAELGNQAMKSTELTAALGLASARQAAAQTRWELAVSDKSNAPKLLEIALEQSRRAETDVASARARVAKVAPAKAEAARALQLAQAVLKGAETVAASRKADLDRISADRAASDKKIAAAKATADAAVAAAKAARAEADALAVEKQQFEATGPSQAVAVSSAKGS